MNHRAWTEADIRALGTTTDLVTGAAILGIGRTKAHELPRAGQFPVPVLRFGRRYLVPTAPILPTPSARRSANCSSSPRMTTPSRPDRRPDRRQDRARRPTPQTA
jgi:hypothetical protein